MEVTLELIGLIYDSVADASRWPRFLEAFVRATRGRQGLLALADPRWDEIAMVCRYGMSDEDVREYFGRLEASDPWVEGARRTSEGQAAPSHELWDEQDMVNSAMYREFLGPRGWHYGMGGVILATENSRSTITMLRAKEEGPCGEPELSLLRALLPHLRRAALLHGELTSLRSQRTVFTEHLDRYPQAFILADAHGRILFANTAARKILGTRDGLIGEAGRLTAVTAKEKTALLAALRKIADDAGAPILRLEITRSSPGLPYHLILMPIPSSRAIPLGISQPAVAILIVDLQANSMPDAALLRELFSLTAAEAKVAAKLAQGRSVEEVASELNVSVDTVRTHLRRTLSKTVTNRQGELISMVLRAIPFSRL